MNANLKAQEFDEYAAAKEMLEQIVMSLKSEQSQSMTHGEVESLIDRDGKELLRRLMQGYLDCRSRDEARHEFVEGEDGRTRRTCRERQRSLMTVFGEVTVRRWGYSGQNVGSVFPLDEALNLPASKYSHGLQRKVGLEVAKSSFEETVEAVTKGTGGRVPKRQAEQIAQAVSGDFESYYANRPVKEAEGVLVMSTDGKGIVVRKEDLREATRKAAETSTQKLKTRLSRGEKRNRKRMATVATVYDIAAHRRTAESIMGQTEDAPQKRPKPENKRVWASLRRPCGEVIEQAFAEAEQRDPERKRTWLMLVDGQESQIREIAAATKRHRAKVSVIQDFVHVLEYLWKAAYCFCKEGTKEAEAWVSKRATALLQSKTSEVAAGMRRSATRRSLSNEARQPVDKCASYLLKNKNRLDYASALSNGWPIATGVIEGACRHLVKDRMDITGARWSLDGAEAVLRLRALRSSGDFEDYLAFHHRQEQLRNRRTHPSFADLKIAA